MTTVPSLREAIELYFEVEGLPAEELDCLGFELASPGCSVIEQRRA